MEYPICETLLCYVHDRVGPLDSQLQYSVTAAKEGFVFTPTDDGVIGHFRSFKLGKIQVQVSTKICQEQLRFLGFEFVLPAAFNLTTARYIQNSI